MKIEKVIERLGYKKNEAQVYLTALFLGECKISDIVTELKLARTSVLVIIDKLTRAGLLNSYKKKNHKYWVAENPDKLMSKLIEEQAILQSALPELKALRDSAKQGKPSVKMYTGADEIKAIIDDIIATKKDFMGIVAWKDWMDIFGIEYINNFTDTLAKNYLKSRFIAPASDQSIKLKANDRAQLRETRFLENYAGGLNTATFIYGGKVAIISLNPLFPSGFLIEDPNICSSMTIFFEKLWCQK